MQWTLSVAIWLQKFNGCKPVAMWSQICNRLDRLKFGRKFAVTEVLFLLVLPCTEKRKNEILREERGIWEKNEK